MPDLTTNYSLKKPLSSEFIKPDDFNYNSDIIDAALHNLDTGKTTPQDIVDATVGNTHGWEQYTITQDSFSAAGNDGNTYYYEAVIPISYKRFLLCNTAGSSGPTVVITSSYTRDRQSYSEGYLAVVNKNSLNMAGVGTSYDTINFVRSTGIFKSGGTTIYYESEDEFNSSLSISFSITSDGLKFRISEYYRHLTGFNYVINFMQI